MDSHTLYNSMETQHVTSGRSKDVFGDERGVHLSRGGSALNELDMDGAYDGSHDNESFSADVKGGAAVSNDIELQSHAEPHALSPGETDYIPRTNTYRKDSRNPPRSAVPKESLDIIFDPRFGRLQSQSADPPRRPSPAVTMVGSGMKG
jgi:hypothetical protein